MDTGKEMFQNGGHKVVLVAPAPAWWGATDLDTIPGPTWVAAKHLDLKSIVLTPTNQLTCCNLSFMLLTLGSSPTLLLSQARSKAVGMQRRGRCEINASVVWIGRENTLAEQIYGSITLWAGQL